MIRGLRKSLREKKSPHTSISSPITNNKTSVSSINDIQLSQANILQSPKRVIKALYDYTPQGPGELEFQKGDFFHVIGNEDDPEWYEACNPSKNQRGMVPVPYFEVFGKTTRTTSQMTTSTTSSSNHRRSSSAHHSHNSANIGTNYNNNSTLTTTNTSSSNTTTTTTTTTLYAVVLYDFKAERSDELDIHVGESIILCAHHDYEWFIAKPIDRLGGPGLVPVSYVSIINLSTGQATGNEIADDINGANLPTVDEWKNKNAKYKASSIPLGNVDESEEPINNNNQIHNNNNNTINNNNNNNNNNNITNNNNVRNSSSKYISRESVRSSYIANSRHSLLQQQHQQHSNNYETQVTESTPFIFNATVDSFHVDNGRYWFQIHSTASNGEIRSLCRYYEDFYDFQIKLLELFPNEAGRSVEQKRILPFIPGPLTYVTDKITKKRQVDLNDYIKELIELPSYISHSNFVKSLFELKHELDHIDTSYNHPRSGDDVSGQYVGDVGETTLIKEESQKTLHQREQVKLKFYYRDDIFALLIPIDINIEELKQKISQRIYDVEIKNFKIYVKNDSSDEILNDSDLSVVLKNKLKILIDDE